MLWVPKFLLICTYVQLNSALDVVTEKNCDQNCFYNPESDEDIPLTYFEPEIRPPEPLTDPRAAIVFQPMARVSPACTKTNRRPVDRLETLQIWVLAQCGPNGFLHWILGYKSHFDHIFFSFTTSNPGLQNY